MQIDFWRVHEESSLLAFSLVTCEAVTLLNLFFTQNSMYFPYCWPLTVLQGWEVLKGRLFLAVISCSSRHLLSLGIQDSNSGKRQPNVFLDVQTLLRTIPKTALTVCACIQRTVPCMTEPAVFPDSTQVLCGCRHGFLSVHKLALSFSPNCFVPRRPGCSLCFPLLC